MQVAYDEDNEACFCIAHVRKWLTEDGESDPPERTVTPPSRREELF